MLYGKLPNLVDYLIAGCKNGGPICMCSYSWAVVPPDQSKSTHVEVLFSVDATILAVDNMESANQRVARGLFLHISFAK
ncbi:hypothetical protein DEU56DRAFT_794465 [Suillus clintonianus]|uniref:uncharacterized protein n=1 Tax=Suillus clintonianus TaxID=1904413 RepID=UPI001B863A61|nr:uncharacterized protein DEU56DRAFT_794465 [Suillus clintonianus]KAG2142442.1 hypothetical protein DEU56DRAFT_794465 [Suillus clintonianus]